MLDFPLQLLIALVGAFVCWRRGDRLWVALVKGVLLSLVATTLLSLTFWITS
jgi:hypothetical protein